MNPSRCTAALALGLLLGVSGCVVNPVTGWPEFTLMSTEQEVALGREAAARVERQLGFIEAGRVNAYVESLGAALARYSPRTDVTYHFAVVDMAEPNAFALPGGWIYVSSGLVALANSEDELAAAIGHEIGHVAARHAAQLQTRAASLGVLALPSMVLGAALGSGGETLGSPLVLLGAGLLASYGRSQERQADAVAQRMAARAGFDPAAMSRLLASLEAASRRDGADADAARAGFFDAHPATPERVAETTRTATGLSWTRGDGIAPTRRSFLERIEGVRVGPDPAAGVFEGARFLNPRLHFSIAFPPEWPGFHTPSAVAVLAPERDAQIRLEVVGEGDDPRERVKIDLLLLGGERGFAVVDSEPIEIAGLPAYRAQVLVGSGADAVSLEITWIAHRGSILRLIGSASPAVFDARQPVMQAVAESFRPLSAADRASLTEQRLRVVAARPGETLGALSQRTGNAWSVEETALANELSVGASLGAGELVKIAVVQPYRAAPGAVAGGAPASPR